MNSTTHGLNNDQVYSEMKKLVTFIKQEAIEKAREIKIKADEEFNIERAKLVRQESTKLDSKYELMIKQSTMKKKIINSTLTNKARLSVLEHRQSKMENLFENVFNKTKSMSEENNETYKNLIKQLMIQGLYSLMEKEVEIECREKDKHIVESYIEEVNNKYQEIFGYKVTIKIKGTYLREDCCGGIVISCLNGTVKSDNTLEKRLDIIKDKMLPTIRHKLFGVNQNRKFYD